MRWINSTYWKEESHETHHFFGDRRYMLTGLVAAITPDEQAASIAGGKLPPGYRDWRLISVAREEGELDDIRAVLGNDKKSDRCLSPREVSSVPRRHHHRPHRLELRGIGRKQDLRQETVVCSRAPQKRRSVHGQGLHQIRFNRRLGVLSI